MASKKKIQALGNPRAKKNSRGRKAWLKRVGDANREYDRQQAIKPIPDEILRGLGRGGTVTGSPSLLDIKARKAGFASYSDYMASREWESIRELFVSRWAAARCVGCGNPHFHLHHITYDRCGRELLTDLLPLCRRCHGRLHDVSRTNNISLRDYETALSFMFGWSSSEVAGKLAEYRSHICLRRQRR